MKRIGLLLVGGLAAALGLAASAAPVAPPPGAQISASLEYVGRVPNSGQIVEGKFDTVGTARSWSRPAASASRPTTSAIRESPQLLDTFQPPEILGANGYWQDEDMDLDVRRNLIIGALDPRHVDVDQAELPRHGHLRRNPGCRSGFYVISYADPENLKQVGDFVELPAGHTTSCIENCHYVWTGGPARRNDQADLGRSPRAGAATAGRSGSPTSPTRLIRRRSRSRSTSGATTERPTTRTTSTSTRTASPGSAAAAACAAAARGTLRDPLTGKMRVAKPWDPSSSRAAALRAAPNGVAQPQTDFIHNSARPLNGKVHASGVADGNIVLMTEEDFSEPCDQGGRIVAADITDSLGGEPAVDSTPEHRTG